ncbi:MAG: hypothetical protein V4549_02850 [Bacteroidota bacterium]
MSINSFYDYLDSISILFSVLTFIVGLLCIKSIKGYLVPLFLIVLVSFITEIISVVYASSNINNFYIFHLFTILEFILISFFYILFFKKYLRPVFLLLPIPVFLIVAFIDYRINGLNSMDSLSASVEAILLSVYALVSFFFVMQKLLFENILSEPFFWINFGILFYFSGGLLIFAFSNYFLAFEPLNQNALWSIPQFLNIFYNILISIGFWKARAK